MSKRPVCYGIIPARYASSRFEGKPLADILGFPMFWHVYQRAQKCPLFTDVVLATDDQRIFDAAQHLDVPVVMTAADHPSGSDRVLEAAQLLNIPDDAVVVNIQGDEPLLEPDMLSELLSPFDKEHVEVSTLATPITGEEAKRPDQVKVVVSASGRALYFSRAPIPFVRDDGDAGFLGHVGLYAYRMRTLKRFVALGQSELERKEKLEQLRLLENDIPLYVVQTLYRTHGVDRPEDISHVINALSENS